jgi:tetratricopeptide (TPR) repeat protein
MTGMTKKVNAAKVVMASVASLITSFVTLAAAPSANAQGFAIGLGVNLGARLISKARDNRRHASYTYTNYGAAPSAASSTDASSVYAGNNNYAAQPVVASDRSTVEATIRVKNMAITAYNAGVNLFNETKYQDAQALFSRAVSLDGSMGDAHALNGVCLEKSGRFDDASREYDLAEQFGAHYGALDYHRGICAGAQKNYKLAAASFQRFLAGNHPADQKEDAQHSLAIIEHNFLAQTSGDYLASASSEGVFRWDTGSEPVRVYIDDKLASSTDAVPVLIQSFKAWSTNSAPVKFVFTDCPEQAQIKCVWTNNQADLGGTQELGLTRINYVNGVIRSAQITLLNLKNDGSRSRGQMIAQASSVDLHEIGHALGLQHSDKAFDTMYPLVAPAGLEFALTQRDINTVSALYAGHGTEAGSGTASSAAKK